MIILLKFDGNPLISFKLIEWKPFLIDSQEYNFVVNWQKMPNNTPRPDIANIMAHLQFGQNLCSHSQDIPLEYNRQMDGQNIRQFENYILPYTLYVKIIKILTHTIIMLKNSTLYSIKRSF